MTWMSLLLAFSLGWAEPIQSTPFDPFVQNFIWHSHDRFDPEYMKNVHLSWRENLAEHIKHPNAIAVCYDSIYAPIEIEFDPRWWNQVDRNEHWSVVFHELGHCICSEDHPVEAEYEKFFNFLDRYGVKSVHTPFLEDGCPKSLMYPIVVESKCIARHKPYYIKELFGHCRKKFPISDIGKDF